MRPPAFLALRRLLLRLVHGGDMRMREIRQPRRGIEVRRREMRRLRDRARVRIPAAGRKRRSIVRPGLLTHPFSTRARTTSAKTTH